MTKISNKKIYNVNLSGAGETTLIEPGVTILGGSSDKLDRYVTIHLNDLQLYVSGAGSIEFKVGNQTVFKRTVTAAGDIVSRDDDIVPTGEGADKQPLKAVVTGAITIIGILRWSFEWSGGNRVKTRTDVNFSGPYA